MICCSASSQDQIIRIARGLDTTRYGSDVMKYRKKPVVIDAWQWDGEVSTLDQFHTDGDEVTFDIQDRTLTIHTLEGDMTANLEDWIIRGVKGELYPCKPDIFEATYEPVA